MVHFIRVILLLLVLTPVESSAQLFFSSEILDCLTLSDEDLENVLEVVEANYYGSEKMYVAPGEYVYSHKPCRANGTMNRDDLSAAIDEAIFQSIVRDTHQNLKCRVKSLDAYLSASESKPSKNTEIASRFKLIEAKSDEELTFEDLEFLVQNNLLDRYLIARGAYNAFSSVVEDLVGYRRTIRLSVEEIVNDPEYWKLKQLALIPQELRPEVAERIKAEAEIRMPQVLAALPMADNPEVVKELRRLIDSKTRKGRITDVSISREELNTTLDKALGKIHKKLAKAERAAEKIETDGYYKVSKSLQKELIRSGAVRKYVSDLPSEDVSPVYFELNNGIVCRKEVGLKDSDRQKSTTLTLLSIPAGGAAAKGLYKGGMGAIKFTKGLFKGRKGTKAAKATKLAKN